MSLGCCALPRIAARLCAKEQLEQRVCECYSVVKQEFDRLLRLPGPAEALPLSALALRDHEIQVEDNRDTADALA